jgi:UDP-glucose 4-epimerase
MSGTVLVTGGSGFIGSHVVDRLRAAGHRPRILDTRPSPWHDGDRGVETVIGDVRRPDDVRRALRGCSAVCHLAAAADVADVEREPAWATELNAMGTLAVLEAARHESVPRVLYASTVWVYSDVPGEVLDEDAALVPPAHLYTAGKLSGELFCRSYAALYGLAPTVLRFGIPYGPRARPAAVVPSFVGRALAGEALTIAGSGEQERAFVYVEDLADGVVRALEHGAPGRTYNLAASETTTIRQLAEVVRDVVGDVEIVHTEGRRADLRGARIVAERAERELGWRPRTPLHDGVARYVAWLREQEQAPAAAVAAAAPASTPAHAARRAFGAGARHRRFERPRAVLRHVAPVTREPVLAGMIAMVAVLSCLLALWGDANGPDQASSVSTVGFAAVLPVAALTFARWPSELHRLQAALSAALGAIVIVVLGLLGVADVAEVGHAHPLLLLLVSGVAAALVGVGPRRRAQHDG